MGRSPEHAGKVLFVLNTRTGNMTLQWNVVCNDWISTIAAGGDDLPNFNADKWSKMFGTSAHCMPCDKDCVEEFDCGVPSHKQRKNNKHLKEDVMPQDMQEEDSLLEPTPVFSKSKVKSQTPSILKQKPAHQAVPQASSAVQPKTHVKTADMAQHEAMN